jgi:hypothetical protein
LWVRRGSMAKKKTTPTAPVVKEKKKYKYQIESDKPLIEGKTYQMTFIDKRTVKQEGEA